VGGDAQKNGGPLPAQGAENLARKRAGSPDDPCRCDEGKKHRTEQTVDVLGADGGEDEIGRTDAEGSGQVEGLAEEVLGGLGPEPWFPGGAPRKEREEGLLRGTDKRQGSASRTACRDRDDGRPFRRLHGDVGEDQSKGPLPVHLFENLRVTGMREDERRGARQGGEHGRQQVRPVLDAQANRLIGGRSRTGEEIPKSGGQRGDFPYGRPGRGEGGGLLLQKGRNRFVHRHFRCRHVSGPGHASSSQVPFVDAISLTALKKAF